MSMTTDSKGPGDHSSTQRVLVVEDDAVTRRLYTYMLNTGGFVVLEAEDGLDALEKLAKTPCDLVITDMNMPRMDGMDLIRNIRNTYAELPVILITAFGTPETEKQARKIGASDYLAKPFNFDELEQRVRRLFQQERTVNLA